MRGLLQLERDESGMRRAAVVDGLFGQVVRSDCGRRRAHEASQRSGCGKGRERRDLESEKRRRTAIMSPVDARQATLGGGDERVESAHAVAVLAAALDRVERDDAVVEDPPDEARSLAAVDRAREDLRMEVGGKGRDGRRDEREVVGDAVRGERARARERREAEGRDDGRDDCVVRRVDVQALVEREVLARVERRVGRRVELAERLLERAGEPLLNPPFADRGLRRLAERCERGRSAIARVSMYSREGRGRAGRTEDVVELDVVRVPEAAPLVLGEERAERAAAKRDKLVGAHELHL